VSGGPGLYREVDVESTSTLPLGRLEALSDGVIAIAITLLALELAVDVDAGDDLLAAILDEWPAYLAYVTSFLTIGVVWMVHSAITAGLRAADGVLYRLNLLLLLLVSFLPFPTKLVGSYVDDEDAERVAVVFYGLTLFAIVVSLTLVVRYASSRPELVGDHVDEEAQLAASRYTPSYVIYAVAIGVGLVFPFAAVALYLGAALYIGVPARTIQRLLRRHESRRS
jgi:uncharacterized membrane protein